MKKISVILALSIFLLATTNTFATVASRAAAAKTFSNNAAIKARPMTTTRPIVGIPRR